MHPLHKAIIACIILMEIFGFITVNSYIYKYEVIAPASRYLCDILFENVDKMLQIPM